MPDWIADSLREFPIVLIVLVVAWFGVKYLREKQSSAVTDLKEAQAAHLRSKEEEIRRLSEANDELRKQVAKLLGDYQRLMKRVLDRGGNGK
jgi:cell division protein FtsB